MKLKATQRLRNTTTQLPVPTHPGSFKKPVLRRAIEIIACHCASLEMRRPVYITDAPLTCVLGVGSHDEDPRKKDVGLKEIGSKCKASFEVLRFCPFACSLPVVPRVPRNPTPSSCCWLSDESPSSSSVTLHQKLLAHILLKTTFFKYSKDLAHSFPESWRASIDIQKKNSPQQFPDILRHKS